MSSTTPALEPEAVRLNPEAVRVGATIKTLRDAHGLRLGEFAARLERSHSYISNIENGRKLAPRPLCVRIAALLGVPLAAIISSEYPAVPETASTEAVAPGLARPAGPEQPQVGA